jgi:AbrB family looped-hinge helix DNA binding protein
MQSTVTGRNQISIPAKLARKMGIHRGSRLVWEETSEPDRLLVRVLPDRNELVERISGSGRRWLRPGADPVGELLRERANEPE